MKSKNTLMAIVMLATLVLFQGFISPAGEDRQAQSLFSKHLQELGLDGQQNSRVQQVLRMVEKQAEKDRSLYPGNPLALIEAAKRRIKMRDKLIHNLLDPEQKKEFNNYLKLKVYTSELFRLKEGLVLNKDQELKIAVILDDFNSQIKDMRKKMRKTRSSGPGMKGGAGGMGMRQRGSGGRMGRGGGMGNQGGVRGSGRFSGPISKMKRLKSKKEKAINKILSEKQRKAYKRIIKFQDEQQALRMNKDKGR